MAGVEGVSPVSVRSGGGSMGVRRLEGSGGRFPAQPKGWERTGSPVGKEAPAAPGVSPENARSAQVETNTASTLTEIVKNGGAENAFIALSTGNVEGLVTQTIPAVIDAKITNANKPGGAQNIEGQSQNRVLNQERTNTLNGNSQIESNRIFEDPRLDPLIQQTERDITAATNRDSSVVNAHNGNGEYGAAWDRANTRENINRWNNFVTLYPDKAKAYASKHPDIKRALEWKEEQERRAQAPRTNNQGTSGSARVPGVNPQGTVTGRDGVSPVSVRPTEGWVNAAGNLEGDLKDKGNMNLSPEEQAARAAAIEAERVNIYPEPTEDPAVQEVVAMKGDPKAWEAFVEKYPEKAGNYKANPGLARAIQGAQDRIRGRKAAVPNAEVGSPPESDAAVPLGEPVEAALDTAEPGEAPAKPETQAEAPLTTENVEQTPDEVKALRTKLETSRTEIDALKKEMQALKESKESTQANTLKQLAELLPLLQELLKAKQEAGESKETPKTKEQGDGMLMILLKIMGALIAALVMPVVAVADQEK